MNSSEHSKQVNSMAFSIKIWCGKRTKTTIYVDSMSVNNRHFKTKDGVLITDDEIVNAINETLNKIFKGETTT